MTLVNFLAALCQTNVPGNLVLLVGCHDKEKRELENFFQQYSILFSGAGSSVEAISSDSLIHVEVKGLEVPSKQYVLKLRYWKDRIFPDSSLIVRIVEDRIPQLVFKLDQSAEILSTVTLVPIKETSKQVTAEDGTASVVDMLEASPVEYENKRKRPRKTLDEDCYRKQRRGNKLNVFSRRRKSKKREKQLKIFSNSNGSPDPPVKQQIVEPITRLIRAGEMGLQIGDIMFHVGPAKVTVHDAWTMIHPEAVKRNRKFTSALPSDITQGWLSDKVLEAYLWRITLVHRDTVFVADTTVAELVKQHSNTDLLWSGVNFAQIRRMFIPIWEARKHWTLLVLDWQQKTRRYFDPVNGDKHTILRSESVPKSQLMQLIDDISAVVDLKTGWDSKSWDCAEPQHYTQTDGHSCGVIVGLFVRCLCRGLAVNGRFDVDEERKKMASVIFGSCYSDLDERNSAVCKICQVQAGENLLKCKSCSQSFHASCLEEPFGETPPQHFTCRWVELNRLRG